MKKPTFSRIALIAFLLFMGLESMAQNLVPFVPRYDEAIKGDMLLIGNNNLSVYRSNSYNGNTNNEHRDNRDKMVYVDIDNDSSTFNSSSASLDVPSNTNCYQVVYAALYWTAVVKGDSPMSDIKFKTPESGSYIDITGEQIYYQNSSNNRNSNAYVYYKNVTDIISGLSNADGTYTVANISSTTSATMNSGRNTEGLSAGWSLFVIYEDPLLPSKYITSFDGFTKINNTGPVADREQSFDIVGFRTIPVGPVRAKYAFSALEGDKSWAGDYLEINGTKISATTAGGNTIRPSDNFFNSSVSIIDPNTNSPIPFTDRNPASSNTLGFDAGIINIPNAGNSIIGNGDTSATIKLGTNTDIYYFYFSAFAIEIIAPKIVLTKIVEDLSGNNIGGELVNLGDELNYVIGFQNVGNDDAKELIIRDILPQNVVFNYPEDMGVLPNGVTVQSYNPATRELIFKVDESVVEIGDPKDYIRFKVTVVKTCSLLNDACSNIISNQAFSRYKGTDNPNFTITDDPSFSSNTGCLLTPGATNFLADVNCNFEEEVILCGKSVTLTAGNGYDAYSWSTSPTGSPVIGTSQSITVKNIGTYYVHNTAIAPCQSIDQTFKVVTYGENSVNPLIPFADDVDICPNDGKQLPNFFLCGANDIRAIETNITDTSSIIWEKLDESSCSGAVLDDCANEDPSCKWNQVGTGANYNINLAGQYRITLNYEGGCFSQYYFNVYSNILVPTATSKDIVCGIPGEIVVGGVPNGYEYSIDGTNYQNSNVFSIAASGVYSVYVKQIGVDSSPCIFSVADIQIRERNFTGTAVVSQPLCHGEKGSVKLAANDGRPQYFYSLSKGTTKLHEVGPIKESDYSFKNLNPGSYTATIATEDGCSETVNFEIINPALLTATAAITAPLSCDDGEITVYPVGGVAPYYYFVNGATEFQSTPEITVSTAGTYKIRVVDANNCSTEVSIKIDATPVPTYTVDHHDVLCYNSKTGEIRFNVTNGNGYSIAYTIDNGNTYTSNPTFSNLDAGSYLAGVKYTMAGKECFSEIQPIEITQADTALTASAGVSELAGCGPSGAGKVRITNPQGGTPPYQYSFDNQGTWVSSNEAFVAPGTYTLYIKDVNGCIYSMPGIILENEPVAPIIGVAEPDFNCDGTATATVTVTNPETASFSYTYLLNGVENTNTTDPKIFLEVPDGEHIISVRYNLESVPTYSNLLYETFGYGEDTTSPGINTQYYCFERQVVETQCNGSPAINDGDYSVTSRVMHPFGTWLQPGDHTPQTVPPTPKGRSLVVNVGDKIPVTAVLYEKEINDIIPNQPIIVDFYAINLIKSQHNIYDPNLLVALVDASGFEISSFPTGDIPKSEKWENYVTTLNPGNNTSLKFILRSNVQQVNGNDVAIDDIRVYQLPKICVTQIDFPFIVEPEKAFKASILNFTNATCFDANDGTITIAAQNFDLTKGFQYSLDGSTWETAMTSPAIIKGLDAGDYTIQVRYEDALDTCDFTLNQKLTEPSVLEVTATKIDATCLIGGTIKAKATGGTPAYKYELLDAAGLTLVQNFPGNGILNNIPAGDYTVRATDANGCNDTILVKLEEVAAPTATIATTSDFCYDATNGATIKVTAADGKAPYEYRINGGIFQKNDTFSNLIPGNYIIVVRDANGCTLILPEEIIAPQLKFSTVLTKDLDCTASSDAVVTGTISGGYAPYTYAVSMDGGVNYTDMGATGTPFSYPVASAGAYQFRITDAKGCTATSGVTTVDPISPPAFTATPTNILCFGDDNGSIKVVIDKTVGTSPFLINVKNGTTNYGTQTSGLPAGTYTVTVTDAKSCNTTETVTIAQPGAIDFDLTKVDITCNNPGGSSLGSITIENVSGGEGPFTYYITNNFGDVISGSPYTATSNENHKFDIINYGIYTVTIIDKNGCELSKQETIASPPSDLEITIDTATIDCATDGTATVKAISAIGSGNYEFGILEFNTPPYTNNYSAPDNPGGTIKTFTNLVPGVTYTFVVHDLTTQCYYVKSADSPIPTASLLESSIAPINVTCKGAADGQVKFEISKFDSTTTSVDYQIFTAYNNVSLGAAVTETVNGTSLTITAPTSLAPGYYYIVFTENGSGLFDGCRSASDIFEITESSVDLTVTAEIVNNANCNPQSGVISAVAYGGTSPYLFQINTSTTAPDVTDALWNSANTFNVAPGVYYVHVMDAYGCVQTIPAGLDLIEDPTPVVAASVTNQCDTVEGNFSIDVSLTTEGIAPYSFSINGGAFQTRTAPFTIDNLASGIHTIEVKDANGCGSEVSVTIDAPLGITPTVSGTVSCSDDDGKITVSAFGGTAPYNYSINSSAPSISLSGNEFSGVPSGIYIVTIEDSRGCTATAEITLESATPVDFTLTPTDVTCYTGTDGMITVNLPASNDNPIYTYEIIAGPSTVAAQSSNVFTGLIAGTYTVQVNSGRGCSNTETIVVNQVDLIVVTAQAVVDYECTTGTNATNFASISVNTVTGGSGTYTKYEFIKGGVTVQAGSENVYTETDLTGGSYTINVYDNNGCVGTTTAVIKPFISLDNLNVSIDTAITCANDEDITVSVNSIGGIPTNLQFVLEDIAGVLPSQVNTTGLFTGLPIGNYKITVTNLDTGCTLQTVHYVNEPNTFDLAVDTVVDVTCFSASDGSATVSIIDRVPTPIDQAGAFSYTVVDMVGNQVTSGTSPNAGPITITGLASGTYTITAGLTNTPFCTVAKNFTITAPTAALDMSTTHTEITCVSGNNDGSISATATGGWPGGYEFELSGASITTIPYSSNSVFSNLSEGTYTVSVRDSRGCVATEMVVLTNPLPIIFTASADTSLLSCFEDRDATITATLPTGGQGSNYSYTLNTILPTVSSSGPQASPVFSGLGAGTYFITVTDGYNCSATSVDIVISQPNPIAANLVATTTPTCNVNATLTLSATGGTSPYEYSTSNTFSNSISFSGSTTFSVPAGTYKYYVRDANGCVAVVSNDIKIEEVPELEIILTGTNLDINCFGDNNGAIVATAQGGLGNYLYALLDASKNPIAGVAPNTSGVFTELNAGVYYVAVVSGDCAKTSEKIEISQPLAPLNANPIISNVSCYGANDGSIEVTASGGTGIIKYAISPQLNQFFDSNVFQNLTAGFYDIIVQDALGCYVNLKVEVVEPKPLIVGLVPLSSVPEICEGDTDGEFSIDVSGGTVPYSVSLDNYDGPYTTGVATQTQFTFTGLNGGDHKVFVRDSQGCESEWDITFPESVKIAPAVEVEYLCENNTPGNRVVVVVDESITDLSELDYSLNGGAYQSSNVFENVITGSGHYIDVRHTNGCIQRTSVFDIAHVDPLMLGIDDGGLNEILAVATGGTGDYQFSLNGEDYGSTSSFIISQSGTYTVTVTDSSGCVATVSRYFEFIDICIPNYFTPNGDNNQDTWAPGCAVNYPNMEFKIFDRYGREVGTYRQGQSWDGKYNERELPTGDYWYIVKLNDGKDDRDFVGHFTLYR